MHYVRNHGAVPRLEWSTHKIVIEELPPVNANAGTTTDTGIGDTGSSHAQSTSKPHSDNADQQHKATATTTSSNTSTKTSTQLEATPATRTVELTMEQLAALPAVTIPITLMCDGNRRKEMNMIRPTRGFSWGPGAASCALWKGVPLHIVLGKARRQSNLIASLTPHSSVFAAWARHGLGHG
jgi:hypothetical protein